MAIPGDGPTTADAVRALARVRDGEDDGRIERIVLAVNAWVRTLPASAVADGAPDWSGDDLQHLVEGSTMLAARMYRRKNSTDGQAAADVSGAVNGAIALLLGLGNWATPSVG